MFKLLILNLHFDQYIAIQNRLQIKKVIAVEVQICEEVNSRHPPFLKINRFFLNSQKEIISLTGLILSFSG